MSPLTPRRPAARRRHARRAGFLVCTALVPLACATASRSEPHPGLVGVGLWREFLELPPERALAIAGDPDRVWVGGASGGHASRSEAEQSALARCQQGRAARRLRAPCRLYASGDEIVWGTW